MEMMPHIGQQLGSHDTEAFRYHCAAYSPLPAVHQELANQFNKTML